MKKFIPILIASFLFTSCASISGNGNVRDENREIANIYEVKTSGSIDVEIRSGDHYSLTVVNDENLLPYVITQVDNGVLNV